MIKHFIVQVLGRRTTTRIRLKFLNRKNEGDFLSGLLIGADPKDSLMLDVGAHFGESLIPFRDYGWRILAFEPDPNPLKKEALTKLANEKVSFEWKAVSDKEGELPIYTSEVSTGITSLMKFHNSHKIVGHVPVTTLAHIVSEKKLKKVTFLKTDCEGFDFMALRGFPWGVGVDPEVVLCEFEDRKSEKLGYNWKEMAHYLVDQGYQVIVSEFEPILEYGQNHPWVGLKQFPCELDHENAWGNLIAIKIDDTPASQMRQNLARRATKR